MKYMAHPRCCKSFIIYNFKGDADSSYATEDPVSVIKQQLIDLIKGDIDYYETCGVVDNNYQVIACLNDEQVNAISAVKSIGFKLVNTIIDKVDDTCIYTFIGNFSNKGEKD